MPAISKEDIEKSTEIIEEVVRRNAKLFATALMFMMIEVLDKVGKDVIQLPEKGKIK